MCDRKHLNNMAEMVFLGGVALGGLVSGIISDRCGRKRTLMTSIFLQSLLGICRLYCIFCLLSNLYFNFRNRNSFRALVRIVRHFKRSAGFHFGICSVQWICSLYWTGGRKLENRRRNILSFPCIPELHEYCWDSVAVKRLEAIAIGNICSRLPISRAVVCTIILNSWN